jgi:hypothetical protein
MMQVIRRFKELGILKIYYFAIFFYALPFISVAIFILDQLTMNKTDMWFWVIFLVGLIPCGVIGLILSAIGLFRSIKNGGKLNRFIGFVGTAAGVLCFIGGLFGIALIYLVVQ